MRINNLVLSDIESVNNSNSGLGITFPSGAQAFVGSSCFIFQSSYCWIEINFGPEFKILSLYCSEGLEFSLCDGMLKCPKLGEMKISRIGYSFVGADEEFLEYDWLREE